MKMNLKWLLVFSIIVALVCASCEEEPPVIPPDIEQDTTSHLINWFVEDLGEYGSTLWDAAIINDTLAYAVGEIYRNDTLYNAVYWNGSHWELKRILYQGGFWVIRTIFAFNENDIWFSAFLRYDGKNFIELPIPPILIGWTINKIWGTSSNDLYVVGDNGNIAHYKNGQWSRIESGTDVKLRDVWGSPDGSIVWASGFEDSYGTVFLRNTGSGFEKVLEITNSNIPHPPNEITHVFRSLWTDKADTVYLGAIGRVYAAPKNTTGFAKENIWWDYLNQTGFPPETNIIRGTGGNDIFVAGYNQFVQHWNGSSWQSYPEIEGDGTWRSMAVNSNLIIVAGENFGTPGSARIARGYRIK